MTDFDFSRLKDVPIPPGRPEARTRAREAALSAFDEAGADFVRCTACGTRAGANTRVCVECGQALSVSAGNPAAAKNIGVGSRFDGRIKLPPRSHTTWRLRPITAIAASISLVVIGGLFVLFVQRLEAPLEHAMRQTSTSPEVALRAVSGGRSQVAESKQPMPRQRGAEARPEEHSLPLASLPINSMVAPGTSAPRPPWEGQVVDVFLSGLRYKDSRVSEPDLVASVDLAAVVDRARSSETGQPQISFNPVKIAAREPVSTFSIAFDRTGYANVRRELEAGRFPPRDTVRIGDMINSFLYAYPEPASPFAPIRATVTVLPSPWNPANKLIHIAIKGYQPGRPEQVSQVLHDDLSSRVAPIADDVKVVIEFNPARIADYRLIGDHAGSGGGASNIGQAGESFEAGRTIIAIYEVTPTVREFVTGLRKLPLEPTSSSLRTKEEEYGYLRTQFTLPGDKTIRSVELPITRDLEKSSVEQASNDVRFSVAVAAFGQRLMSEPYVNAFGYDAVMALANGAKGEDPFGYRADFLKLVQSAKSARP
jgi:hypothetical protein